MNVTVGHKWTKILSSATFELQANYAIIIRYCLGLLIMMTVSRFTAARSQCEQLEFPPFSHSYWQSLGFQQWRQTSQIYRFPQNTHAVYLEGAYAWRVWNRELEFTYMPSLSMWVTDEPNNLRLYLLKRKLGTVPEKNGLGTAYGMNHWRDSTVYGETNYLFLWRSSRTVFHMHSLKYQRLFRYFIAQKYDRMVKV